MSTSITHWGRLEPRSRTDQFDRGLRAEVRDPLWLLARQWQFGEYVGDDAGSPISAEFSYGITPVMSVRTASGQTLAFDPATGCLEALVEQEATPVDVRVRTQAGLEFARLAREHQVDGVLPEFLTVLPITSDTEPGGVVDPATTRFLSSVNRRVIDGGGLLDVIWRGADLATLLPAGTVSPADEQRLDDVAQALATWFADLYGDAPESSWQAERLAYEFTLGTTDQGPPSLTAPEYPGGRLDWVDVDLVAAAAPPHETRTVSFVPTGVRFHGMPASRWWEFEDGLTDFGAIEPNTTDLAALLLADFALVYADDWFLTPLPVPAGSLVQLSGLLVTNTFGETAAIPSAPSAFRMFSLSGDDNGATPILFAAPATSASLEGPPIEEVVLFRDEMANLAWGVEQTLANGLGEPTSGFDAAQREVRGGDVDESAVDALNYRLMTDVAANWLPFQAVLDPARPRSRALELTPFLREDPGGSLIELGPRGAILSPAKQPYRLHEEALPRTARAVTRAFQRVRTADGGSRLWLARRRQPVRPPGVSGLEFDQLS